jgi:hypothetical protein
VKDVQARGRLASHCNKWYVGRAVNLKADGLSVRSPALSRSSRLVQNVYNVGLKHRFCEIEKTYRERCEEGSLDIQVQRRSASKFCDEAMYLRKRSTTRRMP